MKRAISSLLLCAFFSLFLSCGNTYTTPFKNDQIFTQKPLDVDLLEDHGEGFEQRGDYLSSTGGLQPEKGESYKDFESRLVNTLVIQEYDLDSYQALIADQSENVGALKKQLELLEEQNMDLRMQYQVLQNQDKKEDFQRSAFQSYTVQKGDTLQTIAEKFYGTYTGWIALYQFNQFYIKNPNLIEVGDLIWVPAFTGF